MLKNLISQLIATRFGSLLDFGSPIELEDREMNGHLVVAGLENCISVRCLDGLS